MTGRARIPTPNPTPGNLGQKHEHNYTPWFQSVPKGSPISSVQWLSRVQLFATPWTSALQASLSINNSQSLLRLMSIESVMPSNHLILCHPLLLLPQSFPASGSFQMSQLFALGSQIIRVSASAPPNEYSGVISFRMD